MGIATAIRKVSLQENLSLQEAQAAMHDIMNGEATPAQIGAYLMGLRLKGETVEEIAGSARSMRDAANPATVKASMVVDTCGTGGDGANTFNISTTVAFVAAGAGIPVAKHGNRSVSSKSGSADVLRELGLNLELTPQQVAQCVDEVGIGFMFAPKFHPAMKYAIGPRREMGIRTLFNVLGPLTNPAGATRQVMGVYSQNLVEPLAHVLKQLGSDAVFVVHGHDGLDELTTTGKSTVSELRDGVVKTYDLDPTELGLSIANIDDLKGGDPAENATITRAILNGQGTTAQRDIVLLNAAAALVVGDAAQSLAEGVELAGQILDGGKGLEKLEALVTYSQELAS